MWLTLNYTSPCEAKRARFAHACVQRREDVHRVGKDGADVDVFLYALDDQRICAQGDVPAERQPLLTYMDGHNPVCAVSSTFATKTQ
jgi:hypothetical protein